jgi:signal transduction histidine kinase/CHASE3 domain sensor protein
MFKLGRWWDQLRVRQKVWTVVVVLCAPLIAALVVHVTLIQQLLTAQQRHEQAVQSRGQVRLLLGLTVDIEDAFRGYLLTRQDKFLRPMLEAGPRLQPTVVAAVALAGDTPGLASDINSLGQQVTGLLESKRELIRRVQVGRLDEVLEYVRTGKGLALSDALRRNIKNVEGTLDRRIKSLDAEQAVLARRAFWGLLLAVVGGLALGAFSARVLTRSITGPLTLLNSSVSKLGSEAELPAKETLPIRSSDEIGQLARAYEEMAGRIRRHILELEAINAIGNEINTIEPDGLDGLLRRITDRAVEMLQVDVCFVMLRNEKMGCWIVEAASGEWHDKLHKSVMLWEEFPVSVRAFETGQPAFGAELRQDLRPAVVRRNLTGESMLSIPLLSRDAPFGVLVLMQERKILPEGWNLRLAKGFADGAAIAISNARLYEAVQQKRKRLEVRLKQLEHLAETLAHDMKAPGERMEGLAALLLAKHGGTLDQEAKRVLALIQENGRILTERIEMILKVARVGSRHEAIEAVDPSLVIGDILKSMAGELEARKVRVHVARELPMVPCHRAYLRQVFDNLISNAVKFSQSRPDPEIRIEARTKGDRVHFSVIDNGCGIPLQHRTRVFEPFFQTSASSAKGTGIGLTIVKRIVELYGGEVWIEPSESPGTAVTFTLPVLGDLSPGGRRPIEAGPTAPPDAKEGHG